MSDDSRNGTADVHRQRSEASREPARSSNDEERYRHTRTSAAWAGVVVAVLFGVALIDFIAQNTKNVRIEFFSLSGRLPIAVALLAAALAGAVVVLAVGVSRVVQLRLNLRRRRHLVRAQNRSKRGRLAEESPNDDVRSPRDE